jgi:hypothetical protein
MLTLEELCYNDLNWPIRVTVYDHNRNGINAEIGMFETTITEMSQRVAIRGNADREVAYEISREEISTTRGLIVVLKTEIQLDESSIARNSIVNANDNRNSFTTDTSNTTNAVASTQPVQITTRISLPDPPESDTVNFHSNGRPSQPSMPVLHEL